MSTPVWIAVGASVGGVYVFAWALCAAAARADELTERVLREMRQR